MKTLHWIFYTLLNLAALVMLPVCIILNCAWAVVGTVVVFLFAVSVITMEETNEARRKLKKGDDR